VLQLGANVSVIPRQDQTAFRLDMAAATLEDVLGAVLSVFDTGRLTEKDLERIRAEAPESPPKRSIEQLAIERLLPKDEPYREVATLDRNRLKEISLADVERFRRAELVPEILSICVVGDVTKQELAGIFERHAGNWKKPTPKKATHGNFDLVRGIFLVDEVGGDDSEVGIFVPAPTVLEADSTAAMLAWEIVYQQVITHLQSSFSERWHEGGSHYVDLGQRSMKGIVITTTPQGVAPLLDVVSAEMGRVAAGQFDLVDLERARRRFISGIENEFSGNQQSAETLSGFGLRANARTIQLQEIRETSKDAVVKVASTRLRKDAIRVVVRGLASPAKAMLEKAKLAPIIVEPSVPRGSGSPRLSGEKGK